MSSSISNVPPNGISFFSSFKDRITQLTKAEVIMYIALAAISAIIYCWIANRYFYASKKDNVEVISPPPAPLPANAEAPQSPLASQMPDTVKAEALPLIEEVADLRFSRDANFSGELSPAPSLPQEEARKSPLRPSLPSENIARRTLDESESVINTQRFTFPPVREAALPQPVEEKKEKVKKTVKERLAYNRNRALAQQATQTNHTRWGSKYESGSPKEVGVYANGPDGFMKYTRPIDGANLTVGPYPVGSAHCQGARQTMEDAEVAKSFKFHVGTSEKEAHVFGIFDGHGGAGASAFVSQKISDYLKQALEKNNPETLSQDGIHNALRDSFIAMDADYKGEDGTTATVVVIIDRTIYFANLGDSRTILVDNGAAIQMTEDAKPTDKRHLKKICKLGGRVYDERINGILAVGGAIGDKNPQTLVAPGLYCVPSQPQVYDFCLRRGKEAYLVLACDGLWDVVSTEEVGKKIEKMIENKVPLEDMARLLVFGSICQASLDNVSVMVVKVKM